MGGAQSSPGSPPGGPGWGEHRAPLGPCLEAQGGVGKHRAPPGPRLEAQGGGGHSAPLGPRLEARGKHRAHRPYVRLSCLPGCIWLPQERTASNQGAGTISAFLAFQSFVWEFYGIL